MAVIHDDGALPEPDRAQTGDSLAVELVRSLTLDITSGRYEPGDRLPTEQGMMARTGVSRTVVREAIAALRAEGLVITQQGRGAFVARNAPMIRFRIDATELETVQQIINVMELRIGIEVETASLAARRRTPAQLVHVAAAHEDFRRAVDRGGLATDEDYAFHIGIAQASNNPQISRFFEMLGKVIIPRQSIRSSESASDMRRAYLLQVADQHGRLVEAIAAQDAISAQAAMRVHLDIGLNRYRGMAAQMAS